MRQRLLDAGKRELLDLPVLGDALVVTANLEDISPSGACVQFERPVAAGAKLCLMLGRHRFRGTVAYCAYEEIGYFVGIRFDAGKKWSRTVYEPKHLLDPAQVVGRRR